MRDLGHRLDIDQLEHRVGRRLEEHRAGVRPHRCLPGGKIASVDQRRLDAEARQQVFDDIAAASEQGPGRHHMVAGLEKREQRRVDRSHAARGAARRFRAFERAHALLEHVDGGIGIAAIDEAFLVALEAALGLLGVIIDVAGVEEDGLRGLAELAPQRALMHEPGRRAPNLPLLLLVLLCRHGTYSLRSCGHKKTRALARSPKDRDCSHGLLATCLTWLQAGRPNHHEAGLMSLEGPRVKPSRPGLLL